MRPEKIDIAILGGGLAGGLIALALRRLRPEMRVALIERGDSFGGNHLWSFFASDVAAEDSWLVDPLVTARWDGYDVRFPGHARRLNTPYRTLSSERLDQVLRDAMPADALLSGTEIAEAGTDFVVARDGRRLTVGGVIDARGLAEMPHMAGGWQKFLGQTLRLSVPHGLTRPVVMDAAVEQVDGYRFVYCLPFSATEVFVEDTYYSDAPAIDAPRLRRRVADYARQRGWAVASVEREETGVLPVIARGDFSAFWPADEPARAGTRAALVHPLTSYSLPDAVRFAIYVTGLRDLSGGALAQASYDWARAHWRQGGFYRMLTRMLFGAAAPEHRYRMLERFYTLPEPLIERFYAGRSTVGDRLRILAGKPPVPVAAALASLSGHGRALAPLAAGA